MATNPLNEVLEHLRRTELLREGEKLADGRLLESFVRDRNPAALEALVRRHGPMVWGVCRRVLANHHDAEDAFQAAFLVFFRKAASIRRPGLLANWLYGTAYQTARKARQTAVKRRQRERQVPEMPEPPARPQDPDPRPDLRPLLDEELSRLPDKHRAAIVLCDLQGKSRPEAARQLGLPEGTVGSRLARARAMLAKRLARRGLAVSGAALAAALPPQAASAAVPAALLSSTIKGACLLAAGEAAVAGAISAQASALTKGVLRAMLLTKLKTAAGIVLAAGFVLAGGLLTHHVLATRPAQAEGPPPGAGGDSGRPSRTEAGPAGDRAFQLEAGCGVMGEAVSPDGKVLAAGTLLPLTPGKAAYKLCVLDAASGKTLRTFDLDAGVSTDLVFTPDGKGVLGATWDPHGKTQTVRLWDIATGKELRRFAGPEGVLNYGIALSPDGKTLAVSYGGFDPKTGEQPPGEVRLWDITTGKELVKLGGHTKDTSRVAFSPDGALLASAGHDGTVRLWDTKSGLGIRELEPGEVVEGVAFSPDGKTLASIGHEAIKNRLILWDAATGKAIRELPGGRCVAFSPDGRLLASGGDDKVVHLWEAATGKEIAALTGHTNSVSSAHFSPDGKTLVTAGAGDDTVHVWAVPGSGQR